MNRSVFAIGGLAGVGILGVAVAVAVGWPKAEALPPQSTPSAPEPHSVLGGDGRSTVFRKYPGGYVCTTELHVEDRQVGFYWKYSPAYQLGDDPEARTHVLMPVWYWPNYAEWLSEDQLLVAGVSPRNGRTVVEVWGFDSPPSGPSVLPVTSAGGSLEHVWTLPTRDSVDLVLDTADPDQQLVTYAKENLGSPDHAIIRFESSGGIFELDMSSGTLSAVASAIAGSAPLHIPELAHAGPWTVGGTAVDHQVEGYVYGLRTHMYQAPDPQQVILVDDDRSGTIDSVILSDPTGYFHGDDVVATY